MATAAAMLADLIARIGHYDFRRSLGVIAGAGIALRIVLRIADGTANCHSEGYGFFSICRRGWRRGMARADPRAMAAVGDRQRASVAGGLSAIAAAPIARDLLGARAGLLAGAAAASYPHYLWHDTALQETALVNWLTAWVTLVLLRLVRSGTRWLALLAGVLLGAAVLTRETTLPFALLAAL